MRRTGKRSARAFSNDFIGIENFFRVKDFFNLAHDFKLNRRQGFFEIITLRIADAVLARHKTANPMSAAIKKIKGFLQFFFPCGFIKIVTADLNMQVAVACVTEARDTHAEFFRNLMRIKHKISNGITRHDHIALVHFGG